MPVQMFIEQYLACVNRIAAIRGVHGIALVDSDSGMVWAEAGQLVDIEAISEAAVEFWRLHQRLRSGLKSLGNPQALAATFAHGLMWVVPVTLSSPREKLVAVAIATPGATDWSAVQAELRALRSFVNAVAVDSPVVS